MPCLGAGTVTGDVHRVSADVYARPLPLIMKYPPLIPVRYALEQLLPAGNTASNTPGVAGPVCDQGVTTAGSIHILSL